MLTVAWQTLYVSNAGSDTISVVDTDKPRRSSKTIFGERPPLMRGLPGLYAPSASMFTADGKTLYVALADMNAIGHRRSRKRPW